jgi:hypothetical protein
VLGVVIGPVADLSRYGAQRYGPQVPLPTAPERPIGAAGAEVRP